MRAFKTAPLHANIYDLRLQEEGAILAENERYWEAMKYWDEALQLTPDSAALLEMKAQVVLLWSR